MELRLTVIKAIHKNIELKEYSKLLAPEEFTDELIDLFNDFRLEDKRYENEISRHRATVSVEDAEYMSLTLETAKSTEDAEIPLKFSLVGVCNNCQLDGIPANTKPMPTAIITKVRSEEHTSELQSHHELVCRLLIEKKKKNTTTTQLVFMRTVEDPIVLSD